MSKPYDNLTEQVEYEPETEAYLVSYDPDESCSLTYIITSLVAVATDKDQEMMEPLFEVLDPDALEKLFQLQDGQTVRVEFKYCGCEVAAMSDGEVSVTSPADG
jgi:hypothetical protein